MYLRYRVCEYSRLACVSLLLGCLLAGCALHKAPEAGVCHLAPLEADSVALPDFRVAEDRQALHAALQRSIEFLSGQDLNRSLSVCGRTLPLSWLLDSAREFQGILTWVSSEELGAVLAARFDVCQAFNSREEGDVLVTGYYQPRFRASLTKRDPYLYPLYRKPADLITAEVHGEEIRQVVGRLEDGRLIPYWTRGEIENGHLLAGRELLYLESPLDVYTLQVQGSGLVEFEDGGVWQVRYAGSNGHSYTSIGKVMVEEGIFDLDAVDMPKIKRYLTEHPSQVQRILQQNERYIFFMLSGNNMAQGPVGSMGKELTPGYSVALDPDCFPMGGIYFLKTEKNSAASPDDQPQGLNQFVLHQDSGAAIKGSGRVDYFWGAGAAAEQAAGRMKDYGRLYLLLKKGRLDIVRDQ